MNGNVKEIESIRSSKLFILIAVYIFLVLQKRKHDFTQRESGIDYSFHPKNQNKRGYLTAQNRNIKQGDLIVLEVNHSFKKYEVEEIDYYSSPSDMWTASLIDLSYSCWLILKLL
jgi:hypothetical protein